MCGGGGEGKWVVGMFFVCVCVNVRVCILVRTYKSSVFPKLHGSTSLNVSDQETRKITKDKKSDID